MGRGVGPNGGRVFEMRLWSWMLLADGSRSTKEKAYCEKKDRTVGWAACRHEPAHRNAEGRDR